LNKRRRELTKRRNVQLRAVHVYSQCGACSVHGARLRPIPVLGIGIGPIPAVSGGIGYRRYCSRYRLIPVGRRCNDKMPKYRVDGLISLLAVMAANGVDSSMHNQPCAIMLFTAFYNDLPRRATTIAGRAPISKVPKNSPHSADTEPDAIDRTS